MVWDLPIRLGRRRELHGEVPGHPRQRGYSINLNSYWNFHDRWLIVHEGLHVYDNLNPQHATGLVGEGATHRRMDPFEEQRTITPQR
jgi:hypothetical protein